MSEQIILEIGHDRRSYPGSDRKLPFGRSHESNSLYLRMPAHGASLHRECGWFACSDGTWHVGRGVNTANIDIVVVREGQEPLPLRAGRREFLEPGDHGNIVIWLAEKPRVNFTSIGFAVGLRNLPVLDDRPSAGTNTQPLTAADEFPDDGATGPLPVGSFLTTIERPVVVEYCRTYFETGRLAPLPLAAEVADRLGREPRSIYRIMDRIRIRQRRHGLELEERPGQSQMWAQLEWLIDNRIVTESDYGLDARIACPPRRPGGTLHPHVG